MTIQNGIPATLVAGDGWSWADAGAFASHPPTDWALFYSLKPAHGGAITEVAATWVADSYHLNLAPSLTAGLAPGEYAWVSFVRNDVTDDRQTLGSGRITVQPDPTANTGDTRSTAERILHAIDATIEGRVTKDAESYTIEGRSLSRTPIPDLMRLQGVYARKVRAEKNPGSSPISYRRMSM